MAKNYEIGPYDPCPCGSGKKYKFCCAAQAKANRHGKYPIGTIAYYGPDDKTTTKIAASVVLNDLSDPIIERFVGSDVVNDATVDEKIKRFFAKHGVKTTEVSEGIIGCPHEEGIDFPRGQDCPICPFWMGKQGIARRDEFEIFDDMDELDDPDDNLDDQAAGERPEDVEEVEVRLERVEAILGDENMGMDEALAVLLTHLNANLQLPCEVTLFEDLPWEEFYILGPGDQAEHEQLKITQPSCTDRFELLRVSRDEQSEWMMVEDDIAAHVRRISDRKEFVLGLADLCAVDKQSPNSALIADYGAWLVNNQ